MEKVCANLCCAEKGNGQFIYCDISNEMKIEMNIVTVIECSPITMGDTTKGSPLDFYKGNIVVKHLN